MECTENRRDRQDKILKGENGKKVYWGSRRMAGASRVSRATASRAGSTIPEKRHYSRGWRELKNVGSY